MLEGSLTQIGTHLTRSNALASLILYSVIDPRPLHFVLAALRSANQDHISVVRRILTARVVVTEMPIQGASPGHRMMRMLRYRPSLRGVRNCIASPSFGLLRVISSSLPGKNDVASGTVILR